MPLKAPIFKSVYSWTGFYLGGHVGYGGGSFGPDTNPLPLQGAFFPHSVTGMIGGYQAGYNRQLANNVVLGVEADVSFGSPVDAPRLVPAPFNTTIDYIATARGRVGYAMGTWMPYVTGGIAWGQTQVSLNDLGTIVPPKRDLTHVGWTAGLGVEVAVGGNWTAKAEYDYIDLARQSYDLTDVGLPRVNVDPSVHLFKLGLNYRLWETPPWAAPTPVDRTDAASRTDELERAWADHGHHTRLSTPCARPMRARTVFRAAARAARPGRRTHFSAGGSGKAASSISTRNWRRVRLEQHARAGRLSERRSAEGRRHRFRNSARNAISSARHSASAASRKRLRTARSSSPENATSTVSR